MVLTALEFVSCSKSINQVGGDRSDQYNVYRQYLQCWFWGWFANSKKSLCYFPGLMKYTPLLTTCRLPNRRIYVEHFNHSSRGGCFTLTEIYESGSRPLYPMDPTTNERERLSKTMFIWYYHLMLDSTSRTLRCGGIPRTIVLKGLSLRGDFASIAIK